MLFRSCVTSDLFIEDVHFRRRYFSPFDIGHKALAVNISDIAAMGAVPLGFSLSLAVPTGLDQSFWSGFFSGMSGLAQKHALFLSGGDLSRGTSWLPILPSGEIVLRDTAFADIAVKVTKFFLSARLALPEQDFFLLESGMSSRWKPRFWSFSP